MSPAEFESVENESTHAELTVIFAEVSDQLLDTQDNMR